MGYGQEMTPREHMRVSLGTRKNTKKDVTQFVDVWTDRKLERHGNGQLNRIPEWTMGSYERQRRVWIGTRVDAVQALSGTYSHSWNRR
jgi:hypothetical protein